MLVKFQYRSYDSQVQKKSYFLQNLTRVFLQLIGSEYLALLRHSVALM